MKVGATPWQTLAGGDQARGRALRRAADLGTVEVGKLADLIVVRETRSTTSTTCARSQLVFKDGRLVADHRRAAMSR